MPTTSLLCGDVGTASLSASEHSAMIDAPQDARMAALNKPNLNDLASIRAPGKREAFTMRIRVPPSSPLGPNGLFSGLDPLGSHGPQVHVRVNVRR